MSPEIVLRNPRCMDVGDVLAQLHPSQEAWMFLERIPSSWLEPHQIEDGIQLTTYSADVDWRDWKHGRVFCPQWELRWEGNNALYTGSQANLADFVPGPDLPATRTETGYYLWGSRFDRGGPDAFAELQIPRLLRYPIRDAKRVKLWIYEWYDATGVQVASRALRLEGVGQ